MPFRMPLQPRAPLAQHAVEAAAELRRLDLLGVARAHGRETSAKTMPPLRKLIVAVELEVVRREVAPSRGPAAASRRARRGPGSRGCEWSTPSAGARGRLSGAGAEENGRQPGLPVVAVDDVGRRVEAGRQRERPRARRTRSARHCPRSRRARRRRGRRGRSSRRRVTNETATSRWRRVAMPTSRMPPGCGTGRVVCAGGAAATIVAVRYAGSTTWTWAPHSTSAGGSDPRTSPSPPVLAYGTTSDAAIRMRSGAVRDWPRAPARRRRRLGPRSPARARIRAPRRWSRRIEVHLLRARSPGCPRGPSRCASAG